MKSLIFTLTALMSLSSFAQSNYNETCAKRYINASVHLVDIADQFNSGAIGAAEYAAKVAYSDSTVLAMRTMCLNENSDAKNCVAKTKSVYTKLRPKMDVRGVVKGQVAKVRVSQLDLVGLTRGAASGFFRSLRNGNDNICSLD